VAAPAEVRSQAEAPRTEARIHRHLCHKKSRRPAATVRSSGRRNLGKRKAKAGRVRSVEAGKRTLAAKSRPHANRRAARGPSRWHRFVHLLSTLLHR
jgi:hypothetical protein